jgi:tyrosyl-tRNA synthetase
MHPHIQPPGFGPGAFFIHAQEGEAMTATEQVAILMQGTEYGDDTLKSRMARELEERLQEAEGEGRPLRVYCGFDPRTADLHIGHAVPIRKLRQFQDLGHEVTVVVGTGTALIGDPSDKTGARPILGRDQAIANGKTYAEQACRILDPASTRICFNHEWLDALGLQDMIRLGSQFTVQQFMARENFHVRWDRGEPVWLHETFYSLLQGFDAFTLKADVQVGGTDQLFNIVTASRKVMETLGARPNVAVIVGILPGTDGKVKMSKSLSNHISLTSDPSDMFGRVMSIPDEAMRPFFERATAMAPADVEEVLAGHPRDAKTRLAREVVSLFNAPADAARAEEEFVRVHARREAPVDAPEVRLAGPATMVDALLASGLAGTRSEARRLMEQGGVRRDGVVVTAPDARLDPPCLLQVGRRRFARIMPS